MEGIKRGVCECRRDHDHPVAALVDHALRALFRSGRGAAFHTGAAQQYFDAGAGRVLQDAVEHLCRVTGIEGVQHHLNHGVGREGTALLQR